jgi:probable HAF family extracellular repeat protein
MPQFMKTAKFVLISLPLCLSPLAFGQTYKLTDLGDLSWSYSAAHGINRSGNVVGEYEPTNPPAVHAFLFANGLMTDIGVGDGYAVAFGINDANVLVGETGLVLVHGFVYSNGTMSALMPLAGNYCSAHAINKAGQIVGESSTSAFPNAPVHAILYNGGAKTDLGVLGGDYSSAYGINNSNIIVGESDIGQQGVTNVHAFVYTNNITGMKDLGTLGDSYSSAKGVNDSGVIVGEANTAGDTHQHAFVYRNGVMSDLGTLGGATSSASAINSAGHVVGYATDVNEVSCAFLYNGSTVINLLDYVAAGSGFTNLASADAINDAGQIAGSGYTLNGDYHGFLLTPILQLSNPLMTNGHFAVTVEGWPGLHFALLASTNLTDWVSLVTNTMAANTNTFEWTDSTATGLPRRFYRAAIVP